MSAGHRFSVQARNFENVVGALIVSPSPYPTESAFQRATITSVDTRFVAQDVS